MRGLAQETDCIFLMRRQIQQIATQLSRIEGFVPPEGDMPDVRMSGKDKGEGQV